MSKQQRQLSVAPSYEKDNAPPPPPPPPSPPPQVWVHGEDNLTRPPKESETIQMTNLCCIRCSNTKVKLIKKIRDVNKLECMVCAQYRYISPDEAATLTIGGARTDNGKKH